MPFKILVLVSQQIEAFHLIKPTKELHDNKLHNNYMHLNIDPLQSLNILF